MASVGTLNEGHLHASLRAHYAQPGDEIEARVDGYIVDILRGDLIIEVQTANFSSIARKIRDLVTRHRVRLVHPIPRDRWIVKMPQRSGERASRRKSPRHLDVIDVFCELVSFPELIDHPNLQLDVVLTAEEEVRSFQPGKRWRRRGWVTVERRLVQVYETVSLRHRTDYAWVIPAGLPDAFLTSDMATQLGCSREVAQKVAYCLRNGGLIEKVGARGNSIVYARVCGGRVADTLKLRNGAMAGPRRDGPSRREGADVSAQYVATIADIDRERGRLRRLLRAKDPKVLNRRPPNGDWSIVENVRHLLFAEQLHLGGFLPTKFEWSPLGMTGMTAARFASVGKTRTTDVDEVLAAWDVIHRPIRAAMKSATGADAQKALWRNHRHLRIHTDLIEGLLRRSGA